MSVVIRILVSLAITVSSAAALAVPSLQLYSSEGEWDSLEETWVVSPDPGVTTFDLTAFAVDKGFGSKAGNAFDGSDTNAYLVLSILPPGVFDGDEDAGDFGIVEVDGDDTSDWSYGTPPTEDPMSPHGIFPTWYVTYMFNFGEPDQAVFNTSGDGFDATPKDIGFRRDFTVDFGGLFTAGSILHVDLFTLDEEGEVHKVAPFSHDAEAIISVPEPSQLVLFGMGLLLLVAARYRRAG